MRVFPLRFQNPSRGVIVASPGPGRLASGSREGRQSLSVGSNPAPGLGLMPSPRNQEHPQFHACRSGIPGVLRYLARLASRADSDKPIAHAPGVLCGNTGTILHFPQCEQRQKKPGPACARPWQRRSTSGNDPTSVKHYCTWMLPCIRVMWPGKLQKNL